MTETRNPLPAAGRETDPFAAIPDADPATVEVRQRAFAKPEKTVDLFGKTKKLKKVDLNPLQRRWFERNGYLAERTEHHDAWKGRTQDLWGCFDYVAVRADQAGTLYVQVTDGKDAGRRLRKIVAAEVTPVLLAAGNRVEIHVWYQRGGPGTRWEMRVREVTANDLRRAE
jgi:hypothetical protein